MAAAAKESVELATQLDRLERDHQTSVSLVSAGHEPRKQGLEHPHRIAEKHGSLLSMFARALLKEYLDGGLPSEITPNWIAYPNSPLGQRRLHVLAACQAKISQWEAQKSHGELLPPASEAAKYGEQIVDALR